MDTKELSKEDIDREIAQLETKRRVIVGSLEKLDADIKASSEFGKFLSSQSDIDPTLLYYALLGVDREIELLQKIRRKDWSSRSEIDARLLSLRKMQLSLFKNRNR